MMWGGAILDFNLQNRSCMNLSSNGNRSRVRGAVLFLLFAVILWSLVGILISFCRLSGEGYGLQGDLPLHYHLIRVMSTALAEGAPGLDWAGLLDGGRGDRFFTF